LVELGASNHVTSRYLTTVRLGGRGESKQDGRQAVTPSIGLSLPLTGRVASVRQLIDQLMAEVALAESLGFQLVSIPEHRQGPAITYSSPLTLASHMLAGTSRIQVATGVLVLPAHHPIHIAEAVTMLDHLSSGRFALGVGAGYQPVDLEPFGRQLPERGRVLDESLEALTALLTDDEASYEGSYFSFDRVRLRPRPVSRPRPPIWMGSWSRAGIRRAARLCDGWIADPIRTVTEVETMTRHYREAAEDSNAAGRSVVVMREAWVDDNESAARRNFASAIMPVFDYYRRRGALDDSATTFDELAADRFVMGDPAQCVQAVHEITARTEADVVVLQLRHPDGPEHERVLDLIRGLGEALASSRTTGVGSRD
jgi:probable F420-dependent oxidoreductase